MNDKVPNVFEQECSPQAGNFSHFDLWVRVMNIMTRNTRDNDEARDIVPPHWVGARGRAVEQHRQLTRLGQGAEARETYIVSAPVFFHASFLGAVANRRRQRVFVGDFESAQASPSGRAPQDGMVASEGTLTFTLCARTRNNTWYGLPKA